MPKTKTQRKMIIKKRGKVVYKVSKPAPQLVAEIVKHPEKIADLARDRTVLRHLIKGESYDAIAQKLGISISEAYGIAKEVVTKWLSDMQVDAASAKLLDLQRLDALLVILWKDAEPHKIIEVSSGKPVEITVPGDKHAIKLIIEVIQMRARIYGYEAADKMEVPREIRALQRYYIGANPDNL